LGINELQAAVLKDEAQRTNELQRRRAGGSVMKKLAIGTLAVVLLYSMSTLAGEKGNAVTVKGWVSDIQCAMKGDKKCANKDHIKMGSKLALVTDGDNKIWTVENPDKLADYQGHYVQVKGVPNAGAATIKVETASALPEPKE
jgi:hypothetical protein